MNVRCYKHGGWVPRHQADLVRSQETGSGPSSPLHACHECVHTHGLLTINPTAGAWIGRPDAAPIAPSGGPA